MKAFKTADILLPDCDLGKWATIACDQHTSEKEYWDEVEKIVGDKPSTLRITLPEIYLSDNPEKRISDINVTMKKYLDDNLFTEHKNSMIYVERRLSSGKIRRGIVGAIDLEEYDYSKGAKSLVRATEATVKERIPPRVKIREAASLELPHIMILIDDKDKTVIEMVGENKDKLKPAYDCDLMMNGGHITGWFLDTDSVSSVDNALDRLCVGESPLLFAVGDGNHSLATAKECYRKHPCEASRYALVEIVNIHDDALEFEPIYRVLFGIEPEKVINEMQSYFKTLDAPNGQQVECLYEGSSRTVKLPALSKLTVSTLQAFLDDYTAKNPSVKIDYIHGIEETKALAAEKNTIGFLFDGMKKSELFPAVGADGALVRKTFSMGEACDKRYYMEARRITEH